MSRPKLSSAALSISSVDGHVGEEVGVVNSPAHSHRMKKSLALVHLRRDVAEGTVLQLRGEEQSHDVTVEPLPFHDPKKTRTHA